MNKYHIYSATGYVCSSVWAATSSGRIGAIFVSICWLAGAMWHGYLAERHERRLSRKARPTPTGDGA